MDARDDVVGIKLNCLSGRLLSPRRELVEALVELLVRAQLDRRRIVAFERSSRELREAGFPEPIALDAEGRPLE